MQVEDLKPANKILHIEEWTPINIESIGKIQFQMGAPKMKENVISITLDSISDDFKRDYIVDLHEERKNARKPKKQSKKLF